MNTHTQPFTCPAILDSVRSHLKRVETWHQTPPILFSNKPNGLIEKQHWYNFQLWHEEDKARNPLATDAEIAQVKRNIDKLNQKRNDQIEFLDENLLSWLQTLESFNPNSTLHSETPGNIIDRCSILALKVYHMHIESERKTAEAEQRQLATQKYHSLVQQQMDLHHCLEALLQDVQTGKQSFKLYRQFKMYNDPKLNPAFYQVKK